MHLMLLHLSIKVKKCFQRSTGLPFGLVEKYFFIAEELGVNDRVCLKLN